MTTVAQRFYDQVGTVACCERDGKLLICDECWPDRKRELDRKYYNERKNSPEFRRRRQAMIGVTYNNKHNRALAKQSG